MSTIIPKLISVHPLRGDLNGVKDAADCSIFTKKELEKAALSGENKKAPEPEGILGDSPSPDILVLLGAFNQPT